MTNYTSSQRMRIAGMSWALNGARRYLANSTACGLGICNALTRWARAVSPQHHEAQERQQAASDAKRLLSRALKGHMWLEDWQMAYARRPWTRTRDLASRRAWLQQLIKACDEAS